MKSLLVMTMIATGIGHLLAQSPARPIYRPTWESLDQRPIPNWFREARFGIFVHWGVYSVPAWRQLSSTRYASYAEWYYVRVIGDLTHGGDAFHKRNYGTAFEYRDFAPLFKAELFDPDFWAQMFQRSGAKYVVLTSKHHDGFCLWPTQSSYKKNWNSMDVGPKRDLVGELASAIRKKGLKMGLYYSLIEWESSPTRRQPSGYWLDQKLIDKYAIPRDQYVGKHLLPQLRELVQNYQPALLFADGGEWDESAEYWQTKEFLAWLYNNAPNRDEVVVNDRWCKDMPGKHGDYYSSEYQDASMALNHPWEESRGIGGSYGFNRAENLDDYRTSSELIAELIQVVSRGGNFLLNVGPTADGRIAVIQQQRLADIGDWLRVNGEAIYGSDALREVRLTVPDHTYFTRKDGCFYAICCQWPDTPLIIKGQLPFPVEGVALLGFKEKIKWEQHGAELAIQPPQVTPATVPCTHAYVFKIVFRSEAR